MDETEDLRAAYCDGKGCGPAVKAKVIAALPGGGILALCYHHTNQHRAALTEHGALLETLTQP